MAVKIRLRRMGAKGQPTYRFVVAEEKMARQGRFVENIGHYNPRTDPPTVMLDEARVLHWLSVGAQPTESVARILTRTKTLDKFARVKKGETIDQVLAPAPAQG